MVSENQDANVTTEEDFDTLVANRREKLSVLRNEGRAYPNNFTPSHQAIALHEAHDEKSKESLEEEKITVKVAGRIMLRRLMGKASFMTLQDGSGGRIQLYVRRDDIGEEQYNDFKTWDLGDIAGAEGYLFKTKTGELSVHVTAIVLLTKSLRPLPDKFHGLADKELCYRQRYLDLVMNEASRRVFLMRSRLIQRIREYFVAHNYLEVETPMMQPIPGGATARPFVTHHNTLDMDLYLRVAPELYLKRLVVGGFDRVFEINRNFRNEGISTQHNPEFTMLEFYQAYATFDDLLPFTEALFKTLATDVLGDTTLNYQGHVIDLTKPFNRMTVVEGVLAYNSNLSADDINDFDKAREYAIGLGIEVKPSYGLGKIQLEIFEKTVENELIQPTFVTHYPMEVSPLARKNDDDPFVTDRFELFIAGTEIANGFSELNDPDDQAARFKAQVKEKAAGDVEAMHYDEDYITALEYGMPPTAGEGIGIDRLVMLFTDAPSIRDVLLFPHMRHKRESS